MMLTKHTCVLMPALLALAHAVALPSVQIDASGDVRESAKWWVQVGSQVVSAPPASIPELSQDASNYYYAYGSHEALTDEMKTHRVGGDGRWHLFHLPEGPSMLQLPTRGSRHESFSALLQLQHRQVLGKTFPMYDTNDSYVPPGGQAAIKKEEAAARAITAGTYKQYLTKVTTVDGKDDTRSNSNVDASADVVAFLQMEFKKMGLDSCLQKLQTSDGERSNVVVYIPGTSRETLTVGAHYDSRPFTGAAPGGNDNGSGVAALLAAAKAFTQANLKPVKDLYLVGFAGEEEGLYGSAAFVSGLLGEGESKIPTGCLPKDSFLQMRGNKKQTHSAIILDEIGWKSPSIDASANMEASDSVAGTADLLNHLAQANKLYNGGKILATHSPNPFGSDHMSFIDKGLPAVLVINGDDEAYPSYHSSNDVMGNVDIEYAAEISRMIFGGMVRVAGLQA